MSVVQAVLVAVITSGATAGFLAIFFERQKVLWTAKREACLHALDLVDAVFSNREWTQNDKPLRLLTQPKPSIGDIRSCQNRLTVLCKDTTLVNTYMKCVMGPNSHTDLNELRNAIRKECSVGFLSKVMPFKPLELDEGRVYIGQIMECAEYEVQVASRPPTAPMVSTNPAGIPWNSP